MPVRADDKRAASPDKPPRRVSRAERTRQVQEAITASALELLHTTGVDGLALTKIAAHAGLSNGPLYGRYDSAEDVALELWESTLSSQFERLVTEFHEFSRVVGAEPTPWLLGELTSPSPLTEAAVEVVAVARRFPLLVDTVRADVEQLFDKIETSAPELPRALLATHLTIPLGFVLTSRMIPERHPNWRDVLMLVRDASLREGNWPTGGPVPEPITLDIPTPDTGDAGFDGFVTAVMNVVAKVGFERTTAHRVSRAAGHSFSSAYTHVGTKDELMHTAIGRMIDQIWQTGTSAFIGLDDEAYITSTYALQRGLVSTRNRPLRQLRVETIVAIRHHTDLADVSRRHFSRALAWIPEIFGTKDRKVIDRPEAFWYLAHSHGSGNIALSLLTNRLADIDWRPIGAIANEVATVTTLQPLRDLGKI